MQKPKEFKLSSEIHLIKNFSFESAHFLPNVPPEHKCRRMHGHSFHFTIELKGILDEQSGWLMDFSLLAGVVEEKVVKLLDHFVLNDVAGLNNPTSENICIWIWEKLEKDLPLYCITVSETCTSATKYYGN